MARAEQMAGQWPLMGRDRDLARFRHSLRGGRALLVYGPAGVGKTRFAQECCRLAEADGHPIATASASRAAAALPLGALAHLLPSGLTSEVNPGLLVDRARRDLRELAGDGRLVLFVDDLPLLDPLSLLLLTQLAVGGEVFLVATLRTGEPVPDVLAALWAGDGVVRVDLDDLDRSGVEALLQEVLGGQIGFSALTEFWLAGRGNPLYLRELLLGAERNGILANETGVWRLTGPLPSSPRLLELVGDRIRASGDQGRAVLDRLALCQPLGLDELATSSELTALEELESAGLIQVAASRRRHLVSLAHPVYGQVLQGAMTRIRSRGLLLDQVGRVERHGARRVDDALRIAVWRLDATGTADPALLLSACRLARHTFNHEELERLARAAFAAEGCAESGLILAEALAARCKYDEVDDVLSNLPDPADEPTHQRLVMARAVNLRWGLGRADLADAELERGRRVLPVGLHGELYALQALQSTFADRPAEALALLAQIEPGHRTRMHRYAGAQALAATGLCAEAGALLEEAAPWDQTDPEAAFLHSGVPCMIRAQVHHAAGRLPEAVTEMTRALEHGVEDNLARSLAGYSWQLGRLHLAAGRPRTAARWARDGLAVARANSLPALVAMAAACLATAQAQLGDAAEAKSTLGDLDPALPGSAGMAAQARAWTLAAGGELSAAREILLATAAEKADRHIDCAELLHDVVRLGAAEAVVARLDELALRCDSPMVQARAAHARGAAHRDPVLLEQTAERFAAMGAMLHAAETMTTAAGFWQADGDQRKAAGALARAGALTAGCESARTPGLATVEGQTVPLTQREREICLLAAEGCTSKQIADRLVLSIRTVNNHLQNAYTKLGVGSRSELATALRTA